MLLHLKIINNYILSETLGSTATITKAQVIDGDNTKVRLTLTDSVPIHLLMKINLQLN